MKFAHLLILVSLVGFSSCAYFTERGQAMAACGNDQKCLETVIGAGKAAKAVGDATGIPWAGATAGGMVAFMVLFFARKKKED